MLRPKILINFAITADGKVSTRNATPSGFTSPRDKRRLLEIRSLADAILVGRTTAETDNMSMTIPDADLRAQRIARGQSEHPLRILISNSGHIPGTLQVFKNQLPPIHIYSTEAMPPSTRETLSPLATLHLSPSSPLSLFRVLRDLRARHSIRTLVCEGGPTLVKSLFDENLIDEIYLTIAPKIFGGKKAPGITGLPGDFLPEARLFRLKSLTVENDEAYCHFTKKRSRSAPTAVQTLS